MSLQRTETSILLKQPEVRLIPVQVHLSQSIINVCKAALRALSYYADYAVQKGVSYLVVPSQFFIWPICYVARKLAERTVNALATTSHGQFSASVKTLKINDTTTVSGVEISCHKPEKNKTHIVYFMGNTMLTDFYIDHFISMAKAAEASFSCYNYPGTGLHSTGEILSEKDLLEFGCKVIDQALQNKAPDEKIVIHGYSMGGGVSMVLRRMYAAKGVYFDKIINERSFKSLPDVVKARFPSPLAWCMAPLLHRYGWNLPAKKSAKNLTGKALIMSAPKDRLIVPAAQFINSDKTLSSRCVQYTLSGGHISGWEEKDYKMYAQFVGS